MMMTNQIQTLQIQTLARYVKDARKKAGLTQHNLAAMLGVTDTYISRIENGKIKVMPSVELVGYMAYVFNENPVHILASVGLIDVARLRQRARESYWIALLLNRIATGDVTEDQLVGHNLFAPAGTPEAE